MNRTKSIDHHLTHASSSVLDMIKSLAGIHLIQKSLETLMNNSTWGQRMSLALSTAKMHASDLHKQQNQALSDLNDFNASYRKKIQDGELTVVNAAREKVELKHQLALLNAQVSFKTQLHQFGKAELILSGAFLASATSAYRVFTETGRILVASNSSLTSRLGLTHSILNVQRQIGSDMRQSVEAAADLVDYGYDLDAAFESTLKLVVQMKDGLGLSTKLGAELAVVYERQLRTSARDVADSMARLVNDTSVAADEAGRLAINLGRAVSLMKPGANADLSAVTELVGRYEGALKSLGGQFGGFEELLSKMTTSEGMLQAGVLGVSSPEFLRSKEATKQVIDSFADYAKNFLGSTEGWERALRIQSLAETFGTTTQQVNLMIRAVDEANQQRHTSITLEQRYKDQVFASAEVFTRLKNSIVALAQEAVLPLIAVTTSVLKPIADVLESFQKWPGVVVTAGVVLAGGAIVAVTQIYRVSTALYTMASAAHISAVAIRERAAAEALATGSAVVGNGAAGGATFMARTSSIMGRFIGLAAAPVLAAAVGLAVGVAAGRLIDKFVINPNFKYDSASMKESTSAVVERSLRKFALGGDIDGVQGVVAKAIEMYQTRDHMTGAVAAAKVARQVALLDTLVGDLRFTKASAQHSLGNDPGYDDSMDRLNSAQIELIKIAAKQHQVAIESKAVQKDAEKREQEFQFQMRMDRMMDKANNIPRFENIYNPKR
jgi:hypothetical protein